MDANSIFVGAKFGRWTVASMPYPIEGKQGKFVWCKCECGYEKSVRIGNLKRGSSTSCGCSRRDKLPKIGKRFGRLTVIGEPFLTTEGRHYLVPCRCDCGTEKNLHASSLRTDVNHAVRSCGCLRRDKFPSIGDRFGKLVVTSEPFKAGKKTHVMCRCDCGTERPMAIYQLRTRNRSCGCISPGSRKWDAPRSLQNVYRGLIARCYDRFHPSYENYGGRTIRNPKARNVRVCEQWVKNPQAFFDFALANGWREGLVTHREGDGDYCPECVRFVTHDENMLDRRDTYWVEAFGERKCLAEWTKDPRCTITASGLRSRLRVGIPPELAVTEPPRSPIMRRLTKQRRLAASAT